MKIFRIDRKAESWPKSAAEALLTPDSCPSTPLPVRLIADSAANRNNRPAFVPDFAREGWIVEVRPAIHIGRLGKFIAARFADRYIKSLSLVALLRPADMQELNSLNDSFDGAITLGEEFTYTPGEKLRIDATLEAIEGSDIASTSDLPAQLHADIDLEQLHIEDTVALISRYSMLKSGDIILPASVGIEFPITLNTSLTATAGSDARLIVRLK
jgi:hypothetical protein